MKPLRAAFRTLLLPITAAIAFVAMATLSSSKSATPPASEPEIVIGTHVDLSGPLAPLGEAVRNGLTMAVDEANLAGGIGGRKLKLVVRDDKYNAAMAADEIRLLARQDHAFAVLSPLGTPTATAAISAAVESGLLYLFPLTASEDAYLPLSPLKFSLMPSHSQEIQEGLRRLLNAHADAKVGLIAPDDEIGRMIEEGTAKELDRHEITLTGKARLGAEGKSLEQQLAGLKALGVDLLVLGTDGIQSIKITNAVAGLKWKPLILCSSACYQPEFATLGGAATEGLYSVGQVPMPYPNDPKLGPWAQKYEKRFSTLATLHALSAYRAAHLFVDVLRQAGPSATPAEFSKILETRGSWTDPALGGLPIEFSAADHLGAHLSLLTQIRRGRWTVIADP